MGNAAPRDLPPVDMTPSIIDEQVGEHCIFLYSTTVCGYCTKAKSLLNHINAEYGVAELDTMSSRESGNVFNNLVKRTNCRTVGTFLNKLSNLARCRNFYSPKYFVG